MTTLTEFLLARIAEDEALAAALLDRAGERHDEVRIDRGAWLPDDVDAVALGHARVLAECEAKRRIVEMHAEHESRVATYRSPRWADDMNEADRLNSRKAEARCAATEVVVQALAKVYADHPDYNPEWNN